MTLRPRRRADGLAVETRNDRELVHAAREGDTLAFDNLFYRYRDGIYRLCFAITKDPSAAEEIVVDTFARAHRALARLEPAQPAAVRPGHHPTRIRRPAR